MNVDADGPVYVELTLPELPVTNGEIFEYDMLPPSSIHPFVANFRS
jgi:hypothetical protein